MEKVSKKSERRLARVNPFLATAALAAIGMAAPAFGSTIASVETQPTGTVGVSIGTPTDPAAVITLIASQGGGTKLDGYTYNNWAILANDGTGSIDLFGALPAGTTEPTPTAGDAVSATGTYSPFDGIPEIGSMTALTNVSSGNPVPAPLTTTIPQINQTASTNPIPNNGINEYLLTLDNVTILGSGGTPLSPGQTFPTHATGTYQLTDGTNTLIMFDWASSYSLCGMLGGTVIPQGPVDITGIADVFSPNAEFVPFFITPVPEPASVGLLAMGGLMLLKRRGRGIA